MRPQYFTFLDFIKIDMGDLVFQDVFLIILDQYVMDVFARVQFNYGTFGNNLEVLVKFLGIDMNRERLCVSIDYGRYLALFA